MLALSFVGNAGAQTPVDAQIPPAAELEALGVVVGNISFAKQNVFDLSKPGENKSLYRLANRLHVMTRDSTLRSQLLIKSGDAYSKRLIDESERLLRENSFLYDAKIEAVRLENGVVDLRVSTRDLWTLIPGMSVSRSGGENRTRFTLSEKNLMGTGIALKLNYIENVDRESTSFSFYDKNLGKSRTSLFFEIANNSDGDSNEVRLIRPFYALDARWSAGATFFDDTREVSFYELGEESAEYRVESELHSVFGGWSNGLQNGWVTRWTAGFVSDKRRYTPVPAGLLPSLLPADRSLVYPFIGYELLQDKFDSTSNRDQIDRTEDFYMGTRLWATLGYAAEAFGADRSSLIFASGVGRGFGDIDKKALLVTSTVKGRFEEGAAANAVLSLSGRYYNQISDKRLFYMTVDAAHGDNLDLDDFAELGGETGLRGYPLRYQHGNSRFLVSAEQRYFTDWYPFRLLRVGGAVFADVGRVWGRTQAGNTPLGWLKDVGIGLRLAPTRASGRDIIHVDVAFPLDGDPSIDSVQFLIQSKRSF